MQFKNMMLQDLCEKEVEEAASSTPEEIFVDKLLTYLTVNKRVVDTMRRVSLTFIGILAIVHIFALLELFQITPQIIAISAFEAILWLSTCVFVLICLPSWLIGAVAESSKNNNKMLLYEWKNISDGLSSSRKTILKIMHTYCCACIFYGFFQFVYNEFLLRQEDYVSFSVVSSVVFIYVLLSDMWCPQAQLNIKKTRLSEKYSDQKDKVLLRDVFASLMESPYLYIPVVGVFILLFAVIAPMLF